jgi:hypothetical protein
MVLPSSRLHEALAWGSPPRETLLDYRKEGHVGTSGASLSFGFNAPSYKRLCFARWRDAHPSNSPGKARCRVMWALLLSTHFKFNTAMTRVNSVRRDEKANIYLVHDQQKPTLLEVVGNVRETPQP